MPDNLRLIADRIDVRPLLAALDANPHLWGAITARQSTPGSPHADTRAIFLRWAREFSVESVFTDIEAHDTAYLNALPEARDLIKKVVDLVAFPFEGETFALGRVMLVDLKAGGSIEPHCDEGAYADHYERFHLCLDAEEGSVFMVQDRPGHGEYAFMRPGELWWFNHKKEHWALNESDHGRIHMIVDVVAPHFRRERDA